MNIILGFGDTEKRFEEKLEQSLIEKILENYSVSEALYFTDMFIEETKKYVGAVSNNSHELAEKYKNAADYPDRYTNFWCHVMGDPSYIVVILYFHHINRRHAMSPDGWGMMRSERIFYIRHADIERNKDAKSA